MVMKLLLGNIIFEKCQFSERSGNCLCVSKKIYGIMEPIKYWGLNGDACSETYYRPMYRHKFCNRTRDIIRKMEIIFYIWVDLAINTVILSGRLSFYFSMCRGVTFLLSATVGCLLKRKTVHVCFLPDKTSL